MKDSITGKPVISSDEVEMKLNDVSAGLANQSGHELVTAQPHLVYLS